MVAGTMLENLKVLIVDDEESSRALIRMSIDWEQLHCIVIGEAGNGEQALDLLEENLPDIVLTDIYMPYMDGLELSERIVQNYPETKVIVITGHNEFDYAQRGIKAGVFDFIVKPIDEEEIESTLKKACDFIKSEREMKENYGWLKQQLIKELPYLKEKFLNDLLYSHIEEQDYLRRKKFTDIRVVSDYYQSIIIEITTDKIQTYDSHQKDSYLCYMFINYIKEVMDDLRGVEVYVDNTNNIVILNSDNGNNQEMNKRLEAIKRRIQSHADIAFTIGVGGWYKGYNRIKTSYKEATEAVAYKIVSGINQIITYDELIVSNRSEEKLDQNWKDKLSLYIKGGITDEALKTIEEVFEGVVYQGDIQLKALRLKAIQIIMLMFNAMAEIGISIDEKKIVGEGIFEEVFKVDTLPEIKEVICLRVRDICKWVNVEHVNKQKTIIDKINQYIEENIREQLSLNTISEQFHLNKSYLSRIYKARTGMTLGDYILSLRMERSIVLLRSTDKKAYEIAEEVGYRDPNYFGNSFKKYTGKSISEFRKK